MMTPTEVVRSFYARLSAGDAPGALSFLSDDVEWIPMMDYEVDGRGPQKVLEGMLLPALAEWVDFTLTPVEFIQDRDAVVSSGRFRSTHRETGKLAEVDYAHVWEVRSGRITRFRQFIDTARIQAA